MDETKKARGGVEIKLDEKYVNVAYSNDNQDVAIWLKKNALELQILEFESYLDSIIEIFYIKNAPSSPESVKKPRRKNAE
ncbi:hypothetical protein [Streptococcus equinus]|uniref:hypothetical protein n=1 Tax=Streptococcus equinus TaxID=1335 RepID=UPI0037CEC5B4